jgi:hypothetical protein
MSTVNGSGEIRIYVRMREGAEFMLQLASPDSEGKFPKGRDHYVCAALMYCAFMVEGWVNHVGPLLMSEDEWSGLERKPPLCKLKKIAKITRNSEGLGAIVDYGKEPFCWLNSLFEFRDFLAHPRTLMYKTSGEIDDAGSELRLGESIAGAPKSDFEGRGYSKGIKEDPWKFANYENAGLVLSKSVGAIESVYGAVRAGLCDETGKYRGFPPGGKCRRDTYLYFKPEKMQWRMDGVSQGVVIKPEGVGLNGVDVDCPDILATDEEP